MSSILILATESHFPYENMGNTAFQHLGCHICLKPNSCSKKENFKITASPRWSLKHEWAIIVCAQGCQESHSPAPRPATAGVTAQGPLLPLHRDFSTGTWDLDPVCNPVCNQPANTSAAFLGVFSSCAAVQHIQHSSCEVPDAAPAPCGHSRYPGTTPAPSGASLEHRPGQGPALSLGSSTHLWLRISCFFSLINCCCCQTGIPGYSFFLLIIPTKSILKRVLERNVFTAPYWKVLQSKSRGLWFNMFEHKHFPVLEFGALWTGSYQAFLGRTVLFRQTLQK